MSRLRSFFPCLALAAAAAPALADPQTVPVVFHQVDQVVFHQTEPVIFHNGRIVLNDGQGTVVHALLARDGKVVAVGELDEITKRPDVALAHRVDLGGATAVPGLQDAHGHLESYAESLESLDLRGCTSYEQLIERVRVQAKLQAPGTWIVGRGWDQNLWEGAQFPHHLLLSTQVPKNPVYLTRVDGHAALVNRAALALCKLDLVLDPGPKIQGGRVLTDEEHRATGVLLDSAMQLVSSSIPLADHDTRLRRMLHAQARLLAFGLTAVHDMGTTPATLALLEEMRANGKLELRVVAYLWGNGVLDEKALEGLPLAPDPRDLLCVPGVKLMADGALGSRGAALLEDYKDAPGERGYLILTEDELASRLSAIVKHGLQPAVHAIGDRANRLVLDMYEKLEIALPGTRELRPRIEHAQVIAPKDWPRFPALGVIPSMQPVHATSDMGWVLDRLGPERTRGAYAWRALAPELGRLAFGSDFPVESPDPLQGLFAARTRQDESGVPANGFMPEQRLDGAAALVGFTSGAAYACKQEDRRGRLQAGYACDMTVISVDPVACEPAELLKARVRMTVINGVIVYRAKP